MEDIYRAYILELYRNPLHKDAIDDASVIHRELNPTCGDDITVYLDIKNNQITGVGHQGHGCAISQAAISLLLDEIKGKSVKEALALSKEDMLALLQIPISHTRFKCAFLGKKAVQAGMNDYQNK